MFLKLAKKFIRKSDRFSMKRVKFNEKKKQPFYYCLRRDNRQDRCLFWKIVRNALRHPRRFGGKCNISSLALTRPCTITIIVRDKYRFEVCTEIFSYRFQTNYAFVPRLVCNLKRLRIVDGVVRCPPQISLNPVERPSAAQYQWSEPKIVVNNSCLVFFTAVL